MAQRTESQPVINHAVLDKVAAKKLAQMVNDYRIANRLPPVRISPVLTAVAQAHIIDMALSADGSAHGHWGRNIRGQRCNMHSWTGNFGLSPLCYTGDLASAHAMWRKPAEISALLGFARPYRAEGYEIAHWYSQLANPHSAMKSWMNSSGHLNIILERGMWQGENWQAMGVAIGGHHAFIWFGAEKDANQ